MNSLDIIRWDACNHDDGVSPVLPDGCHDLILRLAPTGQPRWVAVPLMDTAMQVHTRAGEQFIGWRLKPWVQVDTASIAVALQSRSSDDPDKAMTLLGSSLRVVPQLQEALTALARSTSVQQCCRELGVSERSLQRLVSGQSGRPPAYWRALARVRRAAQSLQKPRLSWAELAADHGYADQAHLCREFRRWFGHTPRQFLAQPDCLALVSAPGFD